MGIKFLDLITDSLVYLPSRFRFYEGPERCKICSFSRFEVYIVPALRLKYVDALQVVMNYTNLIDYLAVADVFLDYILQCCSVSVLLIIFLSLVGSCMYY